MFRLTYIPLKIKKLISDKFIELFIYLTNTRYMNASIFLSVIRG